MYDTQTTTQLADLRIQANLTQKVAAHFFGLKDRRTIGEWERGLHRPPPKYRAKLKAYLLDKLLLRRHPQQFYDLWYGLVVKQWGWHPLSDEELGNLFPGSIRKIETFPHHLTISFWGGEQHTAPFMAPPLPAHEIIGRNPVFTQIKTSLLYQNAPVFALDGLPGMGKTTLAIHLAHDPEILAYFQDGVLWAGLGQKGDAFSILGKWARGLGVPNMEIAQYTDLKNRAELVRSLIGTRRMFIVVDDAWDVEKALALQVGGPNCAHILTTRLPDIASDFAGIRTITLNELASDESLALISTLAPDVTQEFPKDSLELVKLSGGLPLLLVLMGKYLHKIARKHQSRRFQYALTQLRDAQTRFQLAQVTSPLGVHPSLDAGTPHTLYATIEISLSVLDESTRRTLSYHSVFPPKPNSFSEAAALEIAQASPIDLDQLVDAGLLENAGEGRYTIHASITDFLRLNRNPEETETRFVLYFTKYLKENKFNLSLLETETNNLLAALETAYKKHMDEALIAGTNDWMHFLKIRGLYNLADDLLTRANERMDSVHSNRTRTELFLNRGVIAEKKGQMPEAEKYFHMGLEKVNDDDIELRGRLLTGLGTAKINLAEYSQAENLLQEGVRFLEKAGNLDALLDALLQLGTVSWHQAKYSQAEEYLQKGFDLVRNTTHYEQLCSFAINLGSNAGIQGQLDRAEEYLTIAYEMAKKINYRERLCICLHSLGALAQMQGKTELAMAHTLEGLTLAREIGLKRKIGGLAQNLGVFLMEKGQFEQAEPYYEEALLIAREMNNIEVLCDVLLNMGMLAGFRKKYFEAETHMLETLTLARDAGRLEVICETLISLAHNARESGAIERAKAYLDEGLAIAQEIHTPLLICKGQKEMGELYLLHGETKLANSFFRMSLETAQTAGFQEMIGYAKYGLARVAFAENRLKDALQLGKESLVIFEDLGAYVTQEIAQWLSSIAELK